MNVRLNKERTNSRVLLYSKDWIEYTKTKSNRPMKEPSVCEGKGLVRCS